MPEFIKQISLIIALLALFLIQPGFGGQLDDNYLRQFGEKVGSELQKTLLSTQEVLDGSPQCGTPLKHGLSRDWSRLETTTQKILAKQLAAPVLSGTGSSLLSASGRFRIHYTASGADAVPSLAWVQTVAQTFDDVSIAYTNRGWRPAPTSGGAPYDVYLRDLAAQSSYGQATSDQPLPSSGFANAFTSFIEIDNDFLNPIYLNALGGGLSSNEKALRSLQITAAHEYHHAIQYGYNFFFEIWYAEATSTWHEDELYDDVNQGYDYIPAWFSNSRLALDIAASVSTGGGYGRWIFNRYLAERNGSEVVRSAWENLAGATPVNSQDIPMAPLLDNLLSISYDSTLGSALLGFAKRVYTRDWSTHTADISLLPPYTPVTSYSSYPVNSTVSYPLPTATLSHHSFAFHRFVPSAMAPANLVINVNGDAGMAAAVFKKTGGSISEIPPDAGGATFIINGFSGFNPATDEVVLLLVNVTDADNRVASFNTNDSRSAPDPKLTVKIAGTGSGSVNSNADFSCISGTCSKQFTPGTVLTLMPTPDGTSVFSGWSGACTNLSGECKITMTADKEVTATFTRQKPFRVAGVLFDTLQAAYAAAGDNGVIQVMEGTFSAIPVALTTNRPITVTLKGGFIPDYSTQVGSTAIQGMIVIQGGTVRMDMVNIR